MEAAESVSSIDTVSAPGLSVWSLVSGSGALQTVFTQPSGQPLLWSSAINLSEHVITDPRHVAVQWHVAQYTKYITDPCSPHEQRIVNFNCVLMNNA